MSHSPTAASAVGVGVRGQGNVECGVFAAAVEEAVVAAAVRIETDDLACVVDAVGNGLVPRFAMPAHRAARAARRRVDGLEKRKAERRRAANTEIKASRSEAFESRV
jgi:hypothetical protein